MQQLCGWQCEPVGFAQHSSVAQPPPTSTSTDPCAGTWSQRARVVRQRPDEAVRRHHAARAVRPPPAALRQHAGAAHSCSTCSACLVTRCFWCTRSSRWCGSPIRCTLCLTARSANFLFVHGSGAIRPFVSDCYKRQNESADFSCMASGDIKLFEIDDQTYFATASGEKI